MARLNLSLLGTLQVALDEQLVRGFESAKVRALLSYLASNAERAHNRDALTGLLWPEHDEATARTNLRQALSNLRRTINDPEADPPFLLVSRDTIQFNPHANYAVDVVHFTALLNECSRHPHRRPELCTPCAQRLTDAVKLYRGPFLDGLFVQDSVAFEEWVLLQREVLQQRVLQALYQLAAYHERRGAYDDAYRYAWRQIEIDPWREEAHCQVMRVLVLRGERPAALAQYETCKRLLHEGLAVEPSEATTALYERIRLAQGDGPIAREQLALPSAHPHNLPPQSTPFIGREAELLEVARLIERPECHLINLVGPGGSGKTRIALQAAAEQIEAFSDGVFFVSLAAVQSSELVVSTIGAALGFTFSGHKDEQAQLLDELRDKEMLLVLDNFEHLLNAGDLLAVLLQSAPGLKVLTTSQERLNLRGEWVVAIAGLPYPDVETVDAAEIENYASIQLFLQSARRTDSAFVPTIQDWPAMSSICKLVGGLPLAIELAAAWAPVLSSGEIAHEIGKNLDFLAAHRRDVPRRHHSMRAAFDHSWSLLSEEERELFMRLSVFRGGFRREAAEQVASATLPLLSALVAKSFLRRNPMGRYEVHELLRQYAQGKLQDVPGANIETQDGHAVYYARFVQQREEQLRGEGQDSAIEGISDEIDNVREAWRWSVERKNLQELSKLLSGLWFFTEIRGISQEAEEIFAQAASALELGVNEEEPMSKEQSILLGRVLGARGGMAARMGRATAARDLLYRSITLLSHFGASRDVAFSLNMLGVVARMQSHYAQAKAYLQESLLLFREAGDRWGTTYSLSDLGNVAYLMGDYSDAKRLHEESLTISRKAGDRRAMIFCLNDMSSVAIALGQYSEAKLLCEEVLTLSQEIAHRWGHANALHRMGTIAVHRGDYTEARSLLQESLAVFDAMGDRQLASMSLQQLGYLAWLEGDYPLAERLLQEALALCRETSFRRGSAAALNILGRVALSAGDERASMSYLHEALAIAAEIEAWPLVLDILVSMVPALTKNNDGTLARRILSLVASHPASEYRTREEARRQIAQHAKAGSSGFEAVEQDADAAASLRQVLEEVEEWWPR
ncbi:MAG: tetratricopeptide repeat protein [Chloroflexota bacterium]